MPFSPQLGQRETLLELRSKKHYANACPRTSEEGKNPKVAKAGTKGAEKEKEKEGRSSTSSEDKGGEAQEETGNNKGEDTMKTLIDEANRMLRNMNKEDVREKTLRGGDQDNRIDGLQRQLDELKRAAMKPFRISRLCPEVDCGLLDSGATHPLRARRKGEQTSHLPSVRVTLAGDKEVMMKLTPTGVIVGEPGTEPIVPMGLVTTILGCKVWWDETEMKVEHPS